MTAYEIGGKCDGRLSPFILSLLSLTGGTVYGEVYQIWRRDESMTMEEAVYSARGADRGTLEQVLSHWDRVAKPLNSLGVLKGGIVRIAGVLGSHHISIDKETIVVTYADNGIIEERVTQTGQEVTAIVAGNMGKGCSCVYLMAEKVGVKVMPADVGMNYYGEIPGVIPERVFVGTKNFLREPAMSREQTVMAMETGTQIVEGLKSRGYNLTDSGEMGIGNTTASSMMLPVLLDQDPGQVTGRETGLTAEGYKRKIRVMKDGIALHRPDGEDPVDVLSGMGGLGLAALVGFYADYGTVGLPVVIDGLVTGAATLVAVGIYLSVKDYLLASHISAGPAGAMVLKALGLKPVIQARTCLGEGTGAVTLFPLLNMTAVTYDRMSSFEEIHVEQYKHLK